jgi:hypothetical protein
MAFADYAAYRAARLAPSQRLVGPTRNTVSGQPASTTTFLVGQQQWGDQYDGAPGGAAVPARESGLGQTNGTNLTPIAVSTGPARAGSNTVPTGVSSSLVLCDRLSHTSGLSGTATGAQTTNLPTAALTRYTTGVGVQIGVRIWTAVGSTRVDVSVSYTNQAGTAGRATTATRFNTALAASRFVWLPLQAGDSGARSVQSLTLSGSTGTAGDIGVVLFKPLACYGNFEQTGGTVDLFTGGGGLFPTILDDACLFTLHKTHIDTATGNYYVDWLRIELAEH